MRNVCPWCHLQESICACQSFEPYFKLWTAAIDFKHSEDDVRARELETATSPQCAAFPQECATVRDAEMTIKKIFERSSHKGGSAGGSKRGSTGDPP